MVTPSMLEGIIRDTVRERLGISVEESVDPNPTTSVCAYLFG
jgi:hypothetical protein